ncbi:kinesin light chain [Ceratobasidium sp. AG-Ba]|nr:kinesin light chain [Ceratobasidium sp. AG-Ba]
MSDRRDVTRALNILILEGGGARGLSSLIILNELMTRLQRKLELNSLASVRDHFDVVAGAGTGAVIACMVGRLGIPIRQAIDCYVTLAEVFLEQKWMGSTRYKTTKLQNAFKKIVKDITGDENTRLMDTSAGGEACKTMVFAMSADNMNAGIPCIFRSYQGAANQMPDCPIWQVLSATMAHPEMFKSIDIGPDNLRQSFVDGGLGCNNPAKHVLGEVKETMPDRQVSTVVSIGTGHPDTIRLSNRSWIMGFVPTDVLGVTKKMAFDAEQVAEEMDSRFRLMKGVYFRFSVSQGVQTVRLSEWEKLRQVAADTQAYMRGARVGNSIDEAVSAIGDRKPTIDARRINGEVQPPAAIQAASGHIACPSPTPSFTGRQDIIDQITECISKGDTQRCVFVLYGLGGAGKTQLALKAVEQTRDLWTEVVFVDATSTETAESSLAGFAKEKGLNESHQSALQWLGNQRERWLMVIDNADDPSVRLGDFLPKCNHGSIVVTTRIPALAMLGQGTRPSYRVGSMTESEGRELLLRKAGRETTSLDKSEQDAVVELLQASGFGYLALAIAQAGAYIRCSECTIAWYRDMFVKNHQRTLEERLPVLAQVDDYHKTVYTTWHMSYQQLSVNSRRLLCLMSFMHYTNIIEEIFQRSAIRLQSYELGIPATESESEVRAYVTECLKPYLDSTDGWDSHAFRHAMADLLSYSLMNFDRASDAYTIHVLVHDWASTVVEHPVEVAREHTALLLAASIDYKDTMDSLTYKRVVEVHVTKLLYESAPPTPNNAVLFSEVYYRAGKREKELELDQIVMAGSKERLGEEHDATLSSMNNVAVDLRQLGQYERALALQEQVVEIRKRVSGNEHRETLIVTRNLARTYFDLGRYTDAQSLHQHILDTSTRVHGHDHPDTLSSMHDLAHTYEAQGRYDQAEALLLKVVDARKRVSGDEHPETLISVHVLASTYYHQGRYDEAESMQEYVVEVRKRRQGDEHPHTLNTMCNLAMTYLAKGRYGEAEELQLKELEASKRVYGEGHPETLTSMLNLALTYYRQGRYEQAEELEKRVVAEQKYTLGASHPRRLLSMRNLLETYRVMGESRRREYDTLERQINELESRAG